MEDVVNNLDIMQRNAQHKKRRLNPHLLIKHLKHREENSGLYSKQEDSSSFQTLFSHETYTSIKPSRYEDVSTGEFGL